MSEEGGGQWVGTALLWGTVRVRGKEGRAVGRYNPTVGYCQGEEGGGQWVGTTLLWGTVRVKRVEGSG